MRTILVAILCQCVSLGLVGQLHAADILGDPLPERAIARLGTTRLRHGNSVGSVAFSADGKLLLSAGGRNASLWDAHSGKQVRSHLFAPQKFLRSVRFFPGDEEYMVVDGEATAHVYDTQTGEERRSFQLAVTPLAQPEFARDGRFVTVPGRLGRVHVWRLTDAGLESQFEKVGGYEHCQFSRDGKWLAAWAKSQLDRVDLKTGEVTASVKLDTHEIMSVDVSPDGKLIATGSDGVTFGVWEADTGKFVWGRDDMKFDNGNVWVQFSPDGETLAVGGYPRLKVSFWSVATQRSIAEFGEDYTARVQWSPDGKRIALWGGRNSIRLLNPTNGKYEPDLPGHEYFPREMVFLDDGKLLASATSNDGSLRIWESATGRQLWVYRFHLAGSATPVPGTQELITSGRNHLARYNYKTGDAKVLESEDIARMLRHWHTAVSPDGRRMAARVGTSRPVVEEGQTRYQGELELSTWDLAAGRPLKSIAMRRTGANAFVEFLPGGEQIVGVTSSANDDEEPGVGRARVVVWNFDDLSEARTLFSHKFSLKENVSTLRDAALSPDGAVVAVGRGKLAAQLIRVADGKLLHECAADPAIDVEEVQFCRGGERLLCGSRGKYCFFDTATGKQLRQFDSPGDVGVASADGKLLAAGDRRGVVTLWNAETGEPLVQLAGHSEQIGGLCFSPHGKSLASASYDTTMLHWDLAEWVK